MKLRIEKFGLTGLIFVLVLSACGKPGGANDGLFLEDEKAVSVVVESVTNGTLEKYLGLSAELSARNEVDIYPDVTGKISYIVKYEGDYVWEGETIAYIDRFQVGANYALAPIISPVSGYVTSLFITEGQTVAMTAPVATIGNIKIIDVLINIPEKNVTEVGIGGKIYLSTPAFPDRVFEGTIYRKDYSVNSMSRTMLVRAEVANSDKELLSGMYSDVEIFVDSVDNMIIVPISAVFEDESEKSYVYLNVSNEAVLREVEIALQTSEYAAVSDGLIEGDEVVIFGREYLDEGTLINPIQGFDAVSGNETEDDVFDAGDVPFEENINTGQPEELS